MAKYNILLIVDQKTTGLQYHRQLIPHSHIGENDPDFNIMSIPNIDAISQDELKDFHMVQFLREVDQTWTYKSFEIINRCKKLGLRVVFDIDDYWHLDKNHLIYDQYKQFDIPRQIEEILSNVDAVTTTTDHLAGMIHPFNQDVTVIANAIDPDQPAWRIRNIDSELMRFGWIGGVHHREDIASMRQSFKRIFADKTIYNRFQLCLAGFNVTLPFGNDKYAELLHLGFDEKILRSGNYLAIVKEFIKKDYNPPVAEFINLERIFTDDYKSVKSDKDYFDYLRQFTPAMDHFANDKPYKRLWGKDVFNYADLYNSIDVALVPLNNTPFNICKSQLKIIEAGFMHKAAIVSEVYPYTIDCVHEDNALMVKPGRNHIDFFTSVRKLVNNPDQAFDLGEALYETVKDKYHIATQNEIRKDLYKQLLK